MCGGRRLLTRTGLGIWFAKRVQAKPVLGEAKEGGLQFVFEAVKITRVASNKRSGNERKWPLVRRDATRILEIGIAVADD